MKLIFNFCSGFHQSQETYPQRSLKLWLFNLFLKIQFWNEYTDYVCPQVDGACIQRYHGSITGAVTVGNKDKKWQKESVPLFANQRHKYMPKQEF